MKYTVLFLGLFLCLGCVSSKESASQQEIDALKTLVENKQIKAEFNWAKPVGFAAGVSGLERLLPNGSNANLIDLIGNPNHFIMDKDSITVYLPYYGRQFMTSVYGFNPGFNFKSNITKYTVRFKEKQQQYLLNFNASDDTDSYQFIYTLYVNGNCNLSVQSAKRSTISYEGNWKPI